MNYESRAKLMHECKVRWETLKARGYFTVEEINAIDKDTPWSEIEPTWWLEMMGELDTLRALQESLLVKYDMEKIKDMYRDWFNNFVSLEGFASHYDISVKEANEVLNMGRHVLYG